MTVVELHYINNTIASNNYLLIGRIKDSPTCGCSFYTEIKCSNTDYPNNIKPSKVYYTINTLLNPKGVSPEPTITITNAPSGIWDTQHPVLCLVKYTAPGETSPSWYIAIPPREAIYHFNVCNPEYSAGTNGYVSYNFIDWFTSYVAVAESELESETNSNFNCLKSTESTGLKTIRYPYLPRSGNTVLNFGYTTVETPYKYIAIRLPKYSADVTKDILNSYAKITISATPLTNINKPRSFETITIYINKKQNDSNRRVNFIRDCTGEILESTSVLQGLVYIQDPNHKNNEYIFIKLGAQTCYSIDYIYTNAGCIMRFVSLKQAVSLANRTITDWDSSEDNSNNYYTSSNLFSNTSFRNNTYPRLIKNYGGTSERNTLLSNSQSFASKVRGIQYFDTTLKKPLFLTSTQTNGTNGWYWVDANGNNPDIPTKGTTEQRPTTGIAEGFEYYNTTVHKKQIYNGSTWLDVEDIADVDSKVNNLVGDISNVDLRVDNLVEGLTNTNTRVNGLIPDIVVSSTSALSTTLTAAINKYYRFDTAVDTLTVTLPELASSSKVQNVIVYLTAGSNADSTTITFAAATPTEGTAAPVYYQKNYTIEAGKTYEINALYNGAAWIVAAVEIVTVVAQSSNSNSNSNSLLMGGFTPTDTNLGDTASTDIQPDNTEDI